MKKLTIRMLALAVMATAIIGFSGVANAAMDHTQCMQNQNLTPEQQAKMQKMHTEFLTATDATRQQLITKRAELKAQMTSPNPDTAKIEAISKELGVLEGKMRAECVKFNAQLTKEGLPACTGMGMGKGGMMNHDTGNCGNMSMMNHDGGNGNCGKGMGMMKHDGKGQHGSNHNGSHS